MRTGVPSLGAAPWTPLKFRGPHSTPRALHACSPRCRGNPGIRKNYEAMASIWQDQLLLVMLTHSFIHSFNIS